MTLLSIMDQDGMGARRALPAWRDRWRAFTALARKFHLTPAPVDQRRPSPMSWAVIACAFALIPFQALAQAATATEGTRAGSESGRAIYEYYCYQCHGYAGDGATLAAQFLQPPPRDFTRLRRVQRSRAAMLDSVRHGRPGTGMKSFARVLDEKQSAAVVDYIRRAFMDGGKRNTGYHTAANGWPDHHRHAAAFPFATGAIAIDATDLSAPQLQGKRLFLSACITCHEGRAQTAAPVWAERVVSYPRNPGTCTPCHSTDMVRPPPGDERHRVAMSPAPLTPRAMRGRQLFVTQCAFCHAEDGSGHNWIGTFLEPHARDLRQAPLRTRLTPEQLRSTILDGLPGTSMPGWRQVLPPEDIEALMDFLSAQHHWPRQNPPIEGPRARIDPPSPTWSRRATPSK